MKKRLSFFLIILICLLCINTGITYALTVRISKSKLSLDEGKSYTLKMIGTKKSVKWASANKKIATVSSKGKVTGVSAGTTKITATVSKKKYTCSVTVKDVLTEKEAAQNIKYKVVETKDDLIVILNNKNKINLEAEIDVIYYDASGTVISKEKDHIWTFQAGKKSVATFSYPYDNDYHRLVYNKVKVKISVDLDSFLTSTSRIDDLKITTNMDSGSLNANVSNTSGTDIDAVMMTALLYKKGAIIAGIDGSIYELPAGEDKTVKFDIPYGDDFKTMAYDDYKIIVNEAYSY